MERTKNLKEPDLICTGDWHLREDVPVSRTDDYWEAQWRKVDFISDLQKKYKCPVICGGDLFNHWKPSPFLLSETIKHLPDQFYTIYGNHDLPQHNIQLANKCGINVLLNANKLQVLDDCHWNQEPNKPSIIIHKTNKEIVKVLVWHVFNYPGRKPWPGIDAPLAGKLLRKYLDFSFIITSDNHKPFVEEYEGRLLVNPGSLMRSTAAQIDHKPRVYLWYADTNTVEPVYLPIQPDVLNREYIEAEKQRDSRMDSFIERLNNEWEVDVAFEANIEAFEKSNSIRKSTMQIVYRSMES